MSPRPDQVAELTRGLSLPLPSISEPIMMVLAETLERAFSELRAQSPETLATGSEPEVTALLVSRLNAMVDGIGEGTDLWRSLVRSVGRSDECISYDGAHLAKQPDLTIWLTNRSARFPVTAEAKLIDGPNGKTEVLYCTQGIKRFIVGEYGWGTREAFMLGYVRDGAAIATKLVPYLAQAAHKATYGVISGPAAFDIASDNGRSQHARSFQFSHQPAPNHLPGEIVLWHIWFAAVE
ncbi:hypothetical protein GRI97_16335 [Altererythrobacter xixiisoli]|uniref:Uncharacterized protein n=2 Tax=Croceibacterium xixiisoli TaxID=1476466 RepID=A0A6I4TZN8_9SPHN|nr:hypothetical protein [Croceibacterium xixiisoli]